MEKVTTKAPANGSHTLNTASFSVRKGQSFVEQLAFLQKKNREGVIKLPDDWWGSEYERVFYDPERVLRTTDELDVFFAIIDPEIAGELLETCSQRNQQRTNIMFLSTKWMNGEWALNFETMAKNLKGNLDNGQHRCLMSVQTGASFLALFINGQNPAVITLLDEMKTRNAGDALLICNNITTYPQFFGGVIKFLDAIYNGNANSFNKSRAMAMSNNAVSRWADDHPELIEEIAELMVYTRNLKPWAFIDSRRLTGLWILCRRIDRDKADSYFRAVATGEFEVSNETTPAKYVHQHLVALKYSNKGSRTGLTMQAKMGIVIKGWNDHYLYGKMRKQRYHISSKFPVLAGHRKLIGTFISDEVSET